MKQVEIGMHVRSFAFIAVAGVVLLAFLLPVPGGSEARRTLPAYYPEVYEGMGRLQKVSLGERAVTIDATRYLLARNVAISTLDFEHAVLSMLKPGMEVGYLLSAKRFNGYRVITRIVQFPQGWVIPN
ncbi:MAG: hypothetical protein ABW116_02860 [Candidatus Sedimenticola sp. 20ELBAFRAG]